MKDAEARQDIVDIKSAITGAMHWAGFTTTALTDGSTTNPIVIDGENYTAKAGDVVAIEGDTYDMAAVRIRVLDYNNNLACYAQLPVEIKAEGAIELVGPSVVTAEGGMCGCYVRTVGKKGNGKITVKTAQTEAVEIVFSISEA